MKTISLLAALLVAVPVVAHADDPTTKKVDGTTVKYQPLSDADVQVVAKLNHINVMEEDIGKYATLHGTKSIKNYGMTMLKDHQAAEKDLVALAKRHGLAVIPVPNDMATNDQDPMAKLKGLEGKKFDAAYIDMMIDGHGDALHLIDTAMADTKDTDFRGLLTNTHAVVQRHLDAARKLQTPAASAER